MEYTKVLFKAITSRTSTSEYAAILNRTLESFYVAHSTGQALVAAISNIESDEDLNAWGAEYTRWQARHAEVIAFKKQLAASRPRDRALVKLHDGLTILMNNRNIEASQTFNMFLRDLQNDHAGANQARDASDRAKRDGDVAFEYCRKQLAKLRSERPELLESLHLPDWVQEM